MTTPHHTTPTRTSSCCKSLGGDFFSALVALCLIILPYFHRSAFAQSEEWHCETLEDTLSNVLGGGQPAVCLLAENYVPDEYTSELTVRINFHFILKSFTDPQNFTQTGDGGIYSDSLYYYQGDSILITGPIYAQLVTDEMNRLLRSPIAPNQPPGNSLGITETKLQFYLAGTYFHEDSVLYRGCNNSLEVLDIAFAEEPNSTINCYHTNPLDTDVLDGCGEGGVAEIGSNRLLIKKAWRSNYAVHLASDMSAGLTFQEALTWRVHRAAILLLHELGHNLNLRHVQCNGSADECDDTPTNTELNAIYGIGNCNSTTDCCQIGAPGACCSNNIMAYFGDHALTPCQLGRIHANIMLEKYNFIVTDYCTSDSTTTIPSNVSIVWENERLMRGDLIIESGSWLTLKCRLYMPEGKRIIIKPGGRLTIDGGQITSACQGLWAGIEVWGNSQLQQSPLVNQGYLELMNDALIENARCAVRLGNLVSISPWVYDWSKTGGVVRGRDSQFLNNRKDVEFLSYSSLNTLGEEIPNTSSFRDCSFTVNRQLNDLGSSLDDRVSLYRVNGVRFTNCIFAVEDEALVTYQLDKRASGIRGSDAGFMVTGSCNSIPPVGGECIPNDITAQTLSEQSGDVTPSVFRNLFYGVHANAPGSDALVQINYSLFESNYRGVYLMSMTNPALFRNRFNITDLDWTENKEYGAMLNSCTGYEVKRNFFEGHTNVAGHRHVGLWINESGGEPNMVYLNDFKDLHAGTIVMGRNRNSENTFIGLEILCDLHNNTLFDIAVVKGKSVSGAVALMQGQPAEFSEDLTAPAGNIFNNLNYNNGENDYHIDQWSAPIIYQHHNVSSSFNVVPWESDVNDVFRVPNLPQMNIRLQGCPKVPRLAAGAEKQLILSHREAGDVLSEDLLTLVDNGDSEFLLQSLADPFAESAALRNLLIGASPYLSDSVLKQMIVRTPSMNQWHLCEVLLANSPLHPEVFSFYESAEPLADYLHNLLVAYQGNGLSPRNQLSAELKEELRLKQHSLGNYVRILLEDDSLLMRSEINTLLDAELDRASLRRKFSHARSSGDLAQAQQILDQYVENPQDEVWKQVMSILLDIDALGGYHNADSSFVSLLSTLESSQKYGSQHAGAMIENLTGIDYVEELFYPNFSTKRTPYTRPSSMEKPALAKVYPNPASGEFFITYVLPVERKNALVRVYNLQGSLVLAEDITKGFGILPLNASRFSNGTYLMQLIMNDEVVATEKFVILN